ncbi:hypothetical protein [Deinococcus petrolearius]|uniref:Uncharacterized protein n=1 Tax=Deinococcus petrolearius TaxID=1751295 RepID=A0ABW1DL48_9DEIO
MTTPDTAALYTELLRHAAQQPGPHAGLFAQAATWTPEGGSLSASNNGVTCAVLRPPGDPFGEITTASYGLDVTGEDGTETRYTCVGGAWTAHRSVPGTAYAPSAAPGLRTAIAFKNHLPHAEAVASREQIGSPAHRAIRRAQLDGNDALAASFAAHAHALKNASGDAERHYHQGACHALALALVLKDSHPALMHEYVELASRALYEAATGEAMPGAEVRPVVRSM